MNRLFEQAKSIKAPVARGTYSYSNAGYALLQLTMERATGQEYGALITKQLEQVPCMTPPLSDADTLNQEISDGYVPFFTGYTPEHEQKHHLLIGAGHLSGTGKQLAQFGVWQLQQHQQLKLPSTFATVEIPNRGGRYGAGLEYYDRKKIDGQAAEFVTHQGVVTGYSAELSFSPTTGKGVVVLSNMYGQRMDVNKVNVQAAFVADSLGLEKPADYPYSPIMAIIMGLEFALIALVLGFAAWKLRLFRPGAVVPGYRRWALVLAVDWFVWLPSLYGMTPAAVGRLYQELPDVALLLYVLLGSLVAWLAVSAGVEVKRARS